METSDPVLEGDETPIGHDLALERVPVDALSTYHLNPRRGAVPKIRESLRTNGQFRPVVANRGNLTGRPDEVLAGNHTLLAAREEGWSTIAVVYVDVDDEHAARIVAADNRTADLGTYDDSAMLELLSDLPDLTGTGFEAADLDDLIAAVQEAAGPAEVAAPPRPFSNDGDGMVRTNGLNDLREDYQASPSRMVIMAYQGARYVWVVERLAELITRYDVESNADVLVRLLEAECDATAPDA